MVCTALHKFIICDHDSSTTCYIKFQHPSCHDIHCHSAGVVRCDFSLGPVDEVFFLSFMGQQASVKLVHGTAAKSLKSHAVMLMDFVCVQKCRSDVSNDCSVGEMVASPHLTQAL